MKKRVKKTVVKNKGMRVMHNNSAPVQHDTACPLPPLSLLTEVPASRQAAVQSDTALMGEVIVRTLKEFGIETQLMNAEIGPVLTTYELLPVGGARVDRIAQLSNNLALALRATSVRVQAPIPGKGVVGIEIPNSIASTVCLKEILDGQEWKSNSAILPLALGKDVGGKDLVADLATMPHLLIAGATGSGKTVCLNSIIAGLIMSRTPDELRLILIDPKIVDFSNYNGLPHLQAPVIANAQQMTMGLQWAIKEMERRYKAFARTGVRNIKGYNSRAALRERELFTGATASSSEEKPMPYIVIIVDELADLILTAKAEIENSIARLAQLSRAVGIHMILATQRSSMNVITGTIKANFPARIAFQVAQKVDSRTILDANGADTLLGRGDMLFLPPGSSKLVRAQGALTTDDDIHAIVKFWRLQAARIQPAPVTVTMPQPQEISLSEMIARGTLPEVDDVTGLIEQSIQIIRQTQRASTSGLQRRLRIGYTRAARIMDLLEKRGIVGPARGSDPREILIDLEGEIPQPAVPKTQFQSEPVLKEVAAKDGAWKVFISAKKADFALARKVFEFLKANGIGVFLSDVSLSNLGNSDYRKEIDRALEHTHHMVVVTSSRENVESAWVEAEWGFFINEKRSGRKTGNLVSILAEGLLPTILPPSLRYYEALSLDDHGLQRLLTYVR